MKRPEFLWYLMLFFMDLKVSEVEAAQLHLGVASNFLSTSQQLAPKFKALTGHDLLISSGSTGMLFAQINQGAPYDVMMAADTATPQKLVAAGLAVEPFIYARGQLILLVNRSAEGACQSILNSSDLKFMAIANPQVAPYGLAAKQYLQSVGWWKRHQSKLVMGENVAQAMQMTVSENATAGLVAASVVVHHDLTPTQCTWQPPVNSHAPIEQAMVLLTRSDQGLIYRQFQAFLQSEEAQKIMQANGYSEQANNKRRP